MRAGETGWRAGLRFEDAYQSGPAPPRATRWNRQAGYRSHYRRAAAFVLQRDECGGSSLDLAVDDDDGLAGPGHRAAPPAVEQDRGGRKGDAGKEAEDGGEQHGHARLQS